MNALAGGCIDNEAADLAADDAAGTPGTFDTFDPLPRTDDTPPFTGRALLLRTDLRIARKQTGKLRGSLLAERGGYLAHDPLPHHHTPNNPAPESVRPPVS